MATTIRSLRRASLEADKAEILGYLAAEGNEYHYTKTHRRFFPDRGSGGKSYLIHYKQDAIEFTNLDIIIQQRFLNLLENVYGYQRIRFGSRWRIRIRQKHMVSDLLAHSRLGCLSWRVPDTVMNGNGQTKAAWCRGYSDGDGTVAKTQICLDSANLAGLRQVQELLESIGINSDLKGPYSRKPYLDRFSLVIYKECLPEYSELIGFNHPRKSYLLNRLLGRTPVVREL